MVNHDQIFSALTSFEVRLLGHDVLKRGTRVAVLAHLDEEEPNVAHHVQAHHLVRVGHLVQGHAVQLERLVVLPHLVANVGHVDLESPGVGEHAVRRDHLVRVHRLVVHLVRRVLARQVQQDLRTGNEMNGG